MARQQPLKLSDLPSNVEHPLGSSLLEGKCVIHVKLTDTCMKSIEALIHSDKASHCLPVPAPECALLEPNRRVPSAALWPLTCRLSVNRRFAMRALVTFSGFLDIHKY